MKTPELIAVNPNIFDQEADFFPLYNGLKPSSMGLRKVNRQEEKLFMFGPSFETFRKSKELARTERLSKYYQNPQARHYPQIIEHMLNRLATQNPQHFLLTAQENGEVVLTCHLTKEELVFDKNFKLVAQTTCLDVPFVDAFDALAMQVSEDLVIHHVPNGQLNPFKSEAERQDFAALIHLSHCNGWDAEWAINQTFNYIHRAVPRIEKIIPNAMRMMLSFLNGEVMFERIAAISFKNSPILNRHESFIKQWSGDFNPASPHLHLRVERQTITGFKEEEAFLFTIRTFLYNMKPDSASLLPEDVKQKRLEASLKVYENPDDKSYAYNVIMQAQLAVRKWLKN